MEEVSVNNNAFIEEIITILVTSKRILSNKIVARSGVTFIKEAAEYLNHLPELMNPAL